MKFNFKSKTGFTLIELLVVIGILAVLAAIAIPSVAGLIDRANISADKTNATEMTNAVERFTSEYELYKQDLSNGTLDTANLDASNSRVFNSTGITSRADVEKFESTGIGGKGIDIDTKYPANESTFKSVIKNYMKTTSSTFEPKQSDMAFYYSPEAGIVAVAKEGSTTSEITTIALTNESAFRLNNVLGTGTTTYHWLNISTNETSDIITNDIVASDTKGHYETFVSKIIQVYNHDAPELNITVNGLSSSLMTSYQYENYKYMLVSPNGWSVSLVSDKTNSTYNPILESINGIPVTSLASTFSGCKNMTTAPEIPQNIITMDNAFSDCTKLENSPKIPDSVVSMNSTFMNCESLKHAPQIPNTVQQLTYTFKNCTGLVEEPVIPEGYIGARNLITIGCTQFGY